MKKHHQQSGFSLIATALFMVVLSVLSLGVYKLVAYQAAVERDVETVQKIAKIEAALETFTTENGRYPCPAPLTIGLDDAAGDFGFEISSNCGTAGAVTGTFASTGVDGEDVRMGALPVRSLNLPDDFIVDSWGHRYLYAVTEVLASPGADLDGNDGDISVVDLDGNSLSSSPSSVQYAVISSGGDTRGAYSLEGALIEACEIGTDAEENCDMNDAVFSTSLEKRFDLGSNTFSHTLAFHSTMTQFQWVAGPFGACVDPGGASCTVPGSGQQTRTVECQTLNGVSANDSQCSGTRPSTTQNCTMSCQWGTGAYGACSAICNGGTQTAPSQCYDINGSTAVANVNCDAGADPGPSTQACNTSACAWQSVFGSCSASCGGGTQSISGVCTNPNAGGASVAGSNCSGSGPSGSQACNTHTCPCSDTSWGPSTSTVCSGTNFTQTSNCGTTRSRTGTKTTGSCAPTPPACTPNWGAATSSQCSGVSFTQTDGCGNSRSATGTKTTGTCAPTPPPAASCVPSWGPSTNSECSGVSFTQTDGCGNSRNATGSSSTGSCAPAVSCSWQQQGSGSGGQDPASACNEDDNRTVSDFGACTQSNEGSWDTLESVNISGNLCSHWSVSYRCECN